MAVLGRVRLRLGRRTRYCGNLLVAVTVIRPTPVERVPAPSPPRTEADKLQPWGSPFGWHGYRAKRPGTAATKALGASPVEGCGLSASLPPPL